MTVEFPTRTPAASEQPGFPVYTPNDPQATTGPTFDSAKAGKLPKSDSPLGDYHKMAQAEPGNERELLFTIGGVPLYAPREEDIPPNLPFKMMRDVRKFGPQIAAINCMAELLGDEALDLLADAPTDIPKSDWNAIMEVLTDKVFSKIQDMSQPGKG